MEAEKKWIFKKLLDNRIDRNGNCSCLVKEKELIRMTAIIAPWLLGHGSIG